MDERLEELDSGDAASEAARERSSSLPFAAGDIKEHRTLAGLYGLGDDLDRLGGAGGKVLLAGVDASVVWHQAMMETVSSTFSANARSPSIRTRASASSFEMPFVNKRQAVSPSMRTAAAGSAGQLSNSDQRPASRTSDHCRGDRPGAPTPVTSSRTCVPSGCLGIPKSVRQRAHQCVEQGQEEARLR